MSPNESCRNLLGELTGIHIMALDARLRWHAHIDISSKCLRKTKTTLDNLGALSPRR